VWWLNEYGEQVDRWPQSPSREEVKNERNNIQGCGVAVAIVESESEGILGGIGVGVGKNVPTPTPTSIYS
jgi:hypothetical protein